MQAGSRAAAAGAAVARGPARGGNTPHVVSRRQPVPGGVESPRALPGFAPVGTAGIQPVGCFSLRQDALWTQREHRSRFPFARRFSAAAHGCAKDWLWTKGDALLPYAPGHHVLF